MKRTQQKTLVDFLKNSQQHAPRKEDEELLLALELSKKEHIREQQRRFAELASNNIPKRRRLIQKHEEEEEDNEDDWFQTVSSRPQQQKTKRVQVVKKEAPAEEPSIEIEDLSEWMTAVKKEDSKQQEAESFVIEDWDTLLQEEPKEDIDDDVINLTNDSQPIPSFHCPECHQEFLAQDILDDHLVICRNTNVISDDEKEESDCSVIDLVDANNEYIVNDTDDEDEHTLVNGDTPAAEEEDDGYLSPLEGFTNINENRNEYNMYFDQLQRKPPKKRKPRDTTNKPAKKKRPYFKRKFYRKKKK